jgi:hypothetical protein
VLAGGWVGLGRRAVGAGLTAAAATLILELVVGFGPILTRFDARLLLGVVAPLAALLVGSLLALPVTTSGLLSASAATLLAVMLLLAVPSLLFVLAPLLLPVILSVPSLAAQPRRDLASLISLPLALLLGLLAGQRLSG